MNITAQIVKTPNQTKLGNVQPGTVISQFGGVYLILRKNSLSASEGSSPFTVPVIELDTLEFNRLDPSNVLYTIVGTLQVNIDG